MNQLLITLSDIAATYWQLHNDRRDSEFIFTAS